MLLECVCLYKLLEKDLHPDKSILETQGRTGHQFYGSFLLSKGTHGELRKKSA